MKGKKAKFYLCFEIFIGSGDVPEIRRDFCVTFLPTAPGEWDVRPVLRLPLVWGGKKSKCSSFRAV